MKKVFSVNIVPAPDLEAKIIKLLMKVRLVWWNGFLKIFRTHTPPTKKNKKWPNKGILPLIKLIIGSSTPDNEPSRAISVRTPDPTHIFHNPLYYMIIIYNMIIIHNMMNSTLTLIHNRSGQNTYIQTNLFITFTCNLKLFKFSIYSYRPGFKED